MRVNIETCTLRGTDISHLWKRKIIFPATFKGDMLVRWRVTNRTRRWCLKKKHATSEINLRGSPYWERYVQSLKVGLLPPKSREKSIDSNHWFPGAKLLLGSGSVFFFGEISGYGRYAVAKLSTDDCGHKGLGKKESMSLTMFKC